MLSCKEVAQRASAMIDGELGAWDLLQMRMHLAMCKGCQRFIGQIRTTRDLIEASKQGDALDDVEAQRIGAILSKLHEGKQQGG